MIKNVKMKRTKRIRDERGNRNAYSFKIHEGIIIIMII